VIVDDGVATGSTARAACQVARAQGASQVVLAVPVAAAEAAEALRGIADEVVCLQIPDSFYAVGQWYEDFRQVPDEEVVGLLKRAAQEPGGAMCAITADTTGGPGRRSVGDGPTSVTGTP
jgi:putative phosphoribosyl transferase